MSPINMHTKFEYFIWKGLTIYSEQITNSRLYIYMRVWQPSVLRYFKFAQESFFFVLFKFWLLMVARFNNQVQGKGVMQECHLLEPNLDRISFIWDWQLPMQHVFPLHAIIIAQGKRRNKYCFGTCAAKGSTRTRLDATSDRLMDCRPSFSFSGFTPEAFPIFGYSCNEVEV